MIIEKIRDVIKELVDIESVHIEHPSNVSNGDYSTNVALVYSKKSGDNPHDFALSLVEKLKKKNLEDVERIEVAGPGFINFFLKEEFFVDGIKQILKYGDNYGKNNINKGKKIIIEFTDPNPFKEFHIGHLMSNTIGESLSRLLEYSGADLKRANYQGDVGMHVAKAVWGIMQADSRDDSSEFLGQSYTRGASAYEMDEKAKKEIHEINKKIYERSDREINEIYDWGKEISLDYFEIIYKRLGTKFDYYFFESKAGKIGKDLVLKWVDKGVFEKSDGAYIFKGGKYGLHTRVFLNSDGLPTYEAKELGLAGMKYTKFPYDESYIVTANEVNEYFKVLLKAMEFTNPLLEQKTTHIGHGMLKLPEGKMSSRKGNVVSAKTLLEGSKVIVFEIMERRDENAANQIVIAAVKYSILKQEIGKNVDWEKKALLFSGDSGPYIQYTTVRANSVLSKSGSKPKTLSPEKVGILEKLLVRFPEVVERALNEFAPQYIVTYITELSSAFNSYYAENKISDNEYRLALANAVSIVLTNGLYLLGIKVPDRM